eukprot:TRINITY_DN1387_c0_g1_i3.p1 TRINITY_DN1387_c0_g1~~TRINITY_DN1387_c0_g1_i3.p1  ORF type:complete len:375 (-),score=72.59 TRINITY_DN1387_c0_g1_i3:927-2051(-)
MPAAYDQSNPTAPKLLHAELVLCTESAFVYCFPQLAPNAEWKIYHDIAALLEQKRKGVSRHLLISSWALDQPWKGLQRELESNMSLRAKQLHVALLQPSKAALLQTLAFCERIFRTHPVATLVEFERWNDAGICCWPVWFAALAVEGAVHQLKKLGRVCGKKNHIQGFGHQCRTASKYDCICVLCRSPEHGAFEKDADGEKCPVLKQVKSELASGSFTFEEFEELMTGMFAAPSSWSETFFNMTQFVELRAKLNMFDSTLSGYTKATIQEEGDEGILIPERKVLVKTKPDLPCFRRELMTFTFLQYVPKTVGQENLAHFFGTLTDRQQEAHKRVLIFERCDETLKDYLAHNTPSFKTLLGVAGQTAAALVFFAQ